MELIVERESVFNFSVPCVCFPFAGASALPFAFHSSENGEVRMDGPPRYSIMNFKYSRGHGNYSWIDVGNYSGLKGEQELLFEGQFEMKMKAYPLSVCSDPCQTGQVVFFYSTLNIQKNLVVFVYISAIVNQFYFVSVQTKGGG